MTKTESQPWHFLVKPGYKLIGTKIYRNEGDGWKLAYTFRGADASMRAYVQFRHLTKEKP